MFIQAFKRAVKELVENGVFTQDGNQRLVKVTISSCRYRCKDSGCYYENDKDIKISTTFPKKFFVSIYVSGNFVQSDFSDIGYAIGPFYKEQHVRTRKSALFGIIKPKYEHSFSEEVEKRQQFVQLFNNELNGFAKITKQYDLEHTRNFDFSESTNTQKYDFEVIF